MGHRSDSIAHVIKGEGIIRRVVRVLRDVSLLILRVIRVGLPLDGVARIEG